MNRLTADTPCHLHYSDCCIKGPSFFFNEPQGFWSFLGKNPPHESTKVKTELITHVIESESRFQVKITIKAEKVKNVRHFRCCIFYV